MNTAYETSEILLITGAGLSAESGISTYRDADGLWQNFDIKQVCHAEGWRKHYREMHAFYSELRQAIGQAQPNAAHREIARWQSVFQDRLHIITQNVDDLLERAGCHSVLHVHGMITRMRCEYCLDVWDIGYKAWNPDYAMCCTEDRPDTRPDIVFFEEPAPLYDRMYELVERITSDANNVVIIIGTDGAVIPIQTMLADKPCKKVLCNLHPSKYMLESIFDEIYTEPATQSLVNISRWLLGE